MKAPTSAIRFSEAQKLLDYGFSTFTYTNLGSKGDIIKNVSLNKGIDKNINLVLEKDVGKLMKKGSNNSISHEIAINENISAPISKGDVLGNIVYTCPDNSTISVNLVAENNVEKITLWNMTTYLYNLWFSLFR